MEGLVKCLSPQNTFRVSGVNSFAAKSISSSGSASFQVEFECWCFRTPGWHHRSSVEAFHVFFLLLFYVWRIGLYWVGFPVLSGFFAAQVEMDVAGHCRSQRGLIRSQRFITVVILQPVPRYPLESLKPSLQNSSEQHIWSRLMMLL